MVEIIWGSFQAKIMMSQQTCLLTVQFVLFNYRLALVIKFSVDILKYFSYLPSQ